MRHALSGPAWGVTWNTDRGLRVGCGWQCLTHRKLERTVNVPEGAEILASLTRDAETSGTDPKTCLVYLSTLAHYAYYIRTELEESIRGGLQKLSATRV
jgi:hypothetical protein